MKEREKAARERINTKLGATRRKSSPGDTVRVKLRKRLLTDLKKVIDLLRYLVRLEDRKVWPIRLIAKTSGPCGKREEC